MNILGPIPNRPRPLRVFDAERRKKLLSLAHFLLNNNPVESTERTVKFLLTLAQADQHSEEVPHLPWLSTVHRSDFDLLSDWDPNQCKAVRQLLPQMRFAARLARRR